MERSTKEDRYLRFTLNSEEYAIAVCRIKEIIKYREVAEVPNTSPLVKGVISLRGAIIPVLDLRRYVGFIDSQPSPRARIMIIRRGKYLAGLPVDSVEGMSRLSSKEVNRVPGFLEKEQAELFNGVLECRDRFIMIVNTDALLDHLKNGN